MEAYLILIISSLAVYLIMFCGILRCFCDLDDLETHNNDVEKQTFTKKLDLDFPEEDLNIRKTWFKQAYKVSIISCDDHEEIRKFEDVEIEE